MKDQLFELENFRGPLDLLLHLVREQELEITEVDLSRLCDQYLSALQLMRDLDINVAGEFLVLASTLVLIKSRAILPREEVDLSEELDPGDELILQLLEYRKFKTLSLELERRAQDRARRHPRGAHEIPPQDEPELEEVGLWDLVGSFARLVEELGLRRRFDTLRQEKPLRAFLQAVLERLLERERWSFRDLVMSSGGESEVFGTFLALLELVKSRQVVVVQDETGGPISLTLRADRDESALAGLFRDEEEGAVVAPAGTPPETPPETSPIAPAERPDPEPLAEDDEGSMV
ncbi:MAG: segregation and condensation protein A [Planctomycetota bacterium]|jgi:segregation and condensation protein A